MHYFICRIVRDHYSESPLEILHKPLQVLSSRSLEWHVSVALEDRCVVVKAKDIKTYQGCEGYRSHRLQDETAQNPPLRLHHCAVRLQECVKIISANEFGAKSHFDARPPRIEDDVREQHTDCHDVTCHIFLRCYERCNELYLNARKPKPRCFKLVYSLLKCTALTRIYICLISAHLHKIFTHVQLTWYRCNHITQYANLPFMCGLKSHHCIYALTQTHVRFPIHS